MDFSLPRGRKASEPALPMINVVFLLLIFFLMSAQIAAPPPFDVTPPKASSDSAAEGERVLYIARDGQLALAQARDEAVWDTLGGPGAGEGGLTLAVDGGLPAATLARVRHESG